MLHPAFGGRTGGAGATASGTATLRLDDRGGRRRGHRAAVGVVVLVRHGEGRRHLDGLLDGHLVEPADERRHGHGEAAQVAEGLLGLAGHGGRNFHLRRGGGRWGGHGDTRPGLRCGATQAGQASYGRGGSARREGGGGDGEGGAGDGLHGWW